MNTGSKQRRFVDEAIRVLRQIGCSIERQHNRHIKVTIAFGGRTAVWIVSSTPKSTNSQGDAISDLRRLLRQLGVPQIPVANDFTVHFMTPYDLLWGIVNDCLQSRRGENQVDLKGMIAQLKALHQSLTDEDLKALADLLERLSSQDSIYSVFRDFKFSSEAGGDWAVIIPDAKPGAKSACHRNIVAFAKQKGGYQGITLNKALKDLVAYYRQCAGVVRLGVLVTDVWRPDDISKFQGDLEGALFQHHINTVPIIWSGRRQFPIVWPWQ